MQPTIPMYFRSIRPQFHSTCDRQCGKLGFSRYRGLHCAGKTVRVFAPAAVPTGTTERASAFLLQPKADGIRFAQFAISFPEPAYNQLNENHGRPEETHLEKKEARPEHAQDRARDRDPEVPAMPEHEAPASRL